MAYNPHGNYGMESALDNKRRDERYANKDKRAQVVPEVKIDKEVNRIAEEMTGLRHEHAVSIYDPYFQNHPEEHERAADMEETARIKSRFAADSEQETYFLKIASAFEYIICERINASEWLGKNIKAQLTSEYDDLVNGVDLYIEDTDQSEDSRKPVGLSVDVTFGKSEKQIREKFEIIKNRLLNRGSLAKLKYYKPIRSASTNPNNETIELPKVIVGVNRDEVYTILKNYDKGVDPKTADPKVGLIMLRQIELQLETFEEFSRKKYAQSEVPSLRRAAETYGEAFAFAQKALNARMSMFKNMNRAWIDERMAKEPVSILLNKMLAELKASI